DRAPPDGASQTAADREVLAGAMRTAEMILTPGQPAWSRAAAVLAVLATGASAALGHPEAALATGALGFGSLALGRRLARPSPADPGLELVRSITGRIAAAERLDGTIAA